MSDLIGFHLAARTARSSGRSALPDAPVVAERRARVRAPRNWTAATLRAVARRSDHLADRLDPVCG